MLSLPVLVAVMAGAMLPLQAAINARLARAVGGPIWAATVSGLILTLALALAGAGLTLSRGGPRTDGLQVLPWWAWTGGLCGAVVLTATTAVAPRLGTAAMIALVVTGQVVCALLLDRFGLFGLSPYALTPRRLAAALLLIFGAALIR